MGEPTKAKKGTEPAGETARESWKLLAGLVYPPPFLPIARELGLRPPAFGALRVLDEPRTMGEVATALNCDNSNVTGIVDTLEEKGLATREPAPRDRRVKLIALTAKGRRVRTRLMRSVETPPQWLQSLSQSDRRALHGILRRASERRGAT